MFVSRPRACRIAASSRSHEINYGTGSSPIWTSLCSCSAYLRCDTPRRTSACAEQLPFGRLEGATCTSATLA
jgi:hypothetical protein